MVKLKAACWTRGLYAGSEGLRRSNHPSDSCEWAFYFVLSTGPHTVPRTSSLMRSWWGDWWGVQYQQICRWFWTRERFIDIELAPVWRCLCMTEDSWQQCQERQHGEMQNWAPGAESLHGVVVQTGNKWLNIIYNFHHLDMLPSWDSWTPSCSVLMSLC